MNLDVRNSLPFSGIPVARGPTELIFLLIPDNLGDFSYTPDTASVPNIDFHAYFGLFDPQPIQIITTLLLSFQPLFALFFILGVPEIDFQQIFNIPAFLQFSLEDVGGAFWTKLRSKVFYRGFLDELVDALETKQMPAGQQSWLDANFLAN